MLHIFGSYKKISTKTIKIFDKIHIEEPSSCGSIAIDDLLPLISGTSHCFLLMDELVVRDSSPHNLLVKYLINFISSASAALQSFSARNCNHLALVCRSIVTASEYPPFKHENSARLPLFHPCLLKDRACLVFLYCLCLWHLLLHPLFQLRVSRSP